jgi:hypothetical protein
MADHGNDRRQVEFHARLVTVDVGDEIAQAGGRIGHVIAEVDVVAADHQQDLVQTFFTGSDPARQILVQAGPRGAVCDDVTAVSLVMRLSGSGERVGRVTGLLADKREGVSPVGQKSVQRVSIAASDRNSKRDRIAHGHDLSQIFRPRGLRNLPHEDRKKDGEEAQSDRVSVECFRYFFHRVFFILFVKFI